jgi:methionine sulfoxide reductase heme-binding subunit
LRTVINNVDAEAPGLYRRLVFRLPRLVHSLPLFWALLAVPAVPMLAGSWTGRIDAMDMLHPTGETSARMMIAAMLIGPLAGLVGPRPWLSWLLARRRAIGVAAFVYAALHLVYYIIDMGSIAAMLDELPIASIWTGWAALALLLLMALTSNQAAMRALKRAWKGVQRLAYPAALLTLLHWWWVHDGAGAAVAHFAPLLLVWGLLVIKRSRFFLPSPQIGV